MILYFCNDIHNYWLLIIYTTIFSWQLHANKKELLVLISSHYDAEKENIIDFIFVSPYKFCPWS